MRPNHTGGLLLLPLIAYCRPHVRHKRARSASSATPSWSIRGMPGGFIGRTASKAGSPEELLDLLGFKEGDIVADIGAGAGFFSLCAAE